MAQRPTLVVGNVTTPDNFADVRAFSCDVADRLRLPAVVAVGRDVDLSLYEGVVLVDGWETSFESAALGCEALMSDMCVMEAHEIYAHPINTTCGHCGEDDPQAAPVWLDERWTTSVCPPCTDVHTRGGLVGVVSVAA
ncbi:hypothetical protein ACFY71_36340 [Streptomyces cinerochromogenes]|uniref:hypothetical protein n=1 Tax=Streptomyces cinerochromogenes TaxID=66422 RepID=UPI0036CF09AC